MTKRDSHIAVRLAITKLLPLALLIPAPLAAQQTPAENEKSGAASATIDPVRRALGEKIAAIILPEGSYAQMMKKTMDQLSDPILAQMFDIPLEDFGKISGASDEAIANGEEQETFGAMLEQQDPHFRERMSITMQVMNEELSKLMSQMEPDIREAMAQIFARKYTAAQLQDINGFFATDSGNSFASNLFSMFTDQEMIETGMKFVPVMMQAMPDIMAKVKKATEHLPPAPPRTDGEAGAYSTAPEQEPGMDTGQ